MQTMQENHLLVCTRLSPSPLSPQVSVLRGACLGFVLQEPQRQKWDKVHQHRTPRSLANLFCRVSTAQNRNPLFSLKAGINDVNAACRRACTGGLERERDYISSACKPIERVASLGHHLDILWYKVIQGHWPIIFRPYLQNALSSTQ